MDIGLLRPDTTTILITEAWDICILRPTTITIVIAEDMLVEVDLSHKIPATLTLVIGGNSNF